VTLDRRRDHPYRAFLHRVNKPARYTGGEFQSVVGDFDAAEVRYALAFPDVYDIGMSHLGTKILYGIVAELPFAVGERVFAPWPDLEAELRARDLPLVSLESFRPLADFEVVGFSLQYELTYTNVLNMLDLGGIPVRAADRGPDAPLVIAGGPTATHPEPLAPFIDAFVIGDGEQTLPRLLEVVRRGKSAGWSRERTLIELAALGGVYCPALYETAVLDDGGFTVVGEPRDPRVPRRVTRHIVDDINAYPFPDNSPVPAAEAIFDRMSVEIARGCTEGCRFCQAGMIYRPVRERDPEQVIDAVMGAIDKAGYDEVSLTTLSTADYSCISPLIKTLNKRLQARNTSMSVASLRAYGLADDLLGEIETIRATSLTFAPEAGSQRMRDVVNKNVTDEDLDTTAHRVFNRGWRKMKCYFMIGLPTEEMQDVEGIVLTARRMRDIGRTYKRDADVTVSVSSHVPKPHTPFQWARMDSPDEIAVKQGRIAALCREHRLKFRRHDARTSYLEGVVGRGDRLVAAAIEHAWRGGARFDGWNEHLRFDAWMAAFEATGVEPDRYLGRLREDIALPWDHIDVGLAEGFLAREWKRATKGRLSPPCGKPAGMQVHHTNVQDADADARKLVCYHCGVACDMEQMRDERVDFLQRLGSLKPVQAPPPVAAEAPAAPSRGPGGKKSRRPPRPPYAGPVHRYRIRYAKQGAEALTSHLDLVRSMPRLFRRAGLPLRYSDGFHPKPVMSFAPALSLGASSTGEVMDVDLVQDLADAEVFDRLRACQTEGLQVLEVKQIDRRAPGIGVSLAMAHYAVELRPATAGEDAEKPEKSALSRQVRRALWAFMAAGSWVGPVRRRGRWRTLDMRRAVTALSVGDDGRVRLSLRLGQDASARPAEIIDAALSMMPGVFAPVEPTDIERVGWSEPSAPPAPSAPSVDASARSAFNSARSSSSAVACS